MKTFKVLLVRSYGTCSEQEWRNLTYGQALSIQQELQNLNPDDLYIIENTEDVLKVCEILEDFE